MRTPLKFRPATCHPERPIYARSLCSRCYNNAHAKGKHLDYPVRMRPLTEVAAEYVRLHQQGLTRHQIAAHIGIARKTLDAAISRGRRKGLINNP